MKYQELISKDVKISLNDGTMVFGNVYGILYTPDNTLKHIALRLPTGSFQLVKAEDIADAMPS
jgi:hypothetical protein